MQKTNTLGRCPRCGENTELNYIIGRPYLLVTCECSFIFGMPHPLLDLPKGNKMFSTGNTLLDLPEVTHEEKLQIIKDCKPRFKKLRSGDVPEHLQGMFQQLPFKVRLSLRWYRIKRSIRIFLKQYLPF